MTDKEINSSIFFFQKHQHNLTNHRRYTKTTGSSKLAFDVTIFSSSLQSILSWNFSEGPLDTDHCVITRNIQTRCRETQSIITKFNTNRTDWHLFSSNEARKQAANSNLLHFSKVLTENCYWTIKLAVDSAIPITLINKQFPSLGGIVSCKC